MTRGKKDENYSQIVLSTTSVLDKESLIQIQIKNKLLKKHLALKNVVHFYKHKISEKISFFRESFWPSWIRIRIPIPDPDLDPYPQI